MRTLFVWIAALLITGVIISPFFWLNFLKKRSVIPYLISSSIIVIIFFVVSVTWIYNLVLKYFINSYDSLGYFDSIYIIYLILFLILMLISPFIFTKILYDKFSLKSVIVSLLCSIAILMFMVYAFVYYIAPKAFETLLNNI